MMYVLVNILAVNLKLQNVSYEKTVIVFVNETCEQLGGIIKLSVCSIKYVVYGPLANTMD